MAGHQLTDLENDILRDVVDELGTGASYREITAAAAIARRYARSFAYSALRQAGLKNGEIIALLDRLAMDWKLLQ